MINYFIHITTKLSNRPTFLNASDKKRLTAFEGRHEVIKRPFELLQNSFTPLLPRILSLDFFAEEKRQKFKIRACNQACRVEVEGILVLFKEASYRVNHWSCKVIDQKNWILRSIRNLSLFL